MTMPANDKDEDLARVLRTGYDVPPPGERFTKDLLERLRGELRRSERRGPAAHPVLRAITGQWRWAAAAAVILGVGIGLAVVANRGGDTSPRTGVPGISPAVPASTPDGTPPRRLVPLEIKLPRTLPDCTPRNIKMSPYIEKPSYAPRPPLMVPEGTVNVSRGKPVSASDSEPIVGELKLVTDGDKESADGGYVELAPGKQWVQIDLGQSMALDAIVLWHYHGEARVYHDVVIQAADDADFIENVRTVYNNDYDNSSGLGLGKDMEYIEDYRGRLIPLGGIHARYVRLYSKGNTSNDQNHYVEVEVFGTPPEVAGVKQAPLKVDLPKPRFE
jgi:hypothetical protein